MRYMKSDMSDWSDMSDQSDNIVNTNYFTVYATPKFEYWVKRVNFTLDAPVSFAHYTFDKALANRSEVYFSPSLSMNWKPNNRFSMTLRSGTGRSPMSLNMIQPGYIMTNYRTFKQGVDAFYKSLLPEGIGKVLLQAYTPWLVCQCDGNAVMVASTLYHGAAAILMPPLTRQVSEPGHDKFYR